MHHSHRYRTLSRVSHGTVRRRSRAGPVRGEQGVETFDHLLKFFRVLRAQIVRFTQQRGQDVEAVRAGVIRQRHTRECGKGSGKVNL